MRHSLLQQVLVRWFGTFSQEELKKFMLLSCIFFLTIASYWLIGVTRDAVFGTLVGMDNIPFATILSVLASFPIIIIYGKLIDTFVRHQVFYALCGFYAISALVFAYLINHPVIGVENSLASAWRITGWLYYLWVESFASLMPTLFWSFVADITTPDEAKRGYALIVFGGQIGGILGPLLVKSYVCYLGTGCTILLIIPLVLAIIFFIRIFMRVIPADQLAGFHGKNEVSVEKQEQKTDFAEGLGLVVSHPYLRGIFGIMAFNEIVISLFDFNFKILAARVYTGHELAAFFGNYGIWVNSAALLCLLLGVNNIARLVNLRTALIVLPIMSIGATLALSIKLTLMTAFSVMICIKGLTYALSQPTKEQLYIPTTKAAKYKSKAWIDMFGFRSAKAVGWGLGLAQKAGFASPLPLAFVIISAWLLSARYVGKAHKTAVEKKMLIC